VLRRGLVPSSGCVSKRLAASPKPHLFAMFSKMSAGRFEKEHKTIVGPGAYHVRSFTDLHSARDLQTSRSFTDLHSANSSTNLERDSLVLDSSSSSFQVFDEAAADRPSKGALTSRTPRRQLFASAKENRVPLGPFLGKANNQESCREVFSDPEPQSQQVVRRRSLAEEKMRLQADAKVVDMAVAKKSAVRAQAQLQAKDRQLAEALKRVDELTAAHAEAQRTSESWQADSHSCRKVLHEKDETIAALKKNLQLSKANTEDSSRRPEQVRTLQELTVAQAQRLTWLDAELQDKTRELETTRQQLADLEGRFQAYSLDADAHVQKLTKTQEHIRKCVVEMTHEGERQAEEFEERLAEFSAREVRTDTEAALRHVYLGATLRLLEKEGSSRQRVEAELTSLQSEVMTLNRMAEDEEQEMSKELEMVQHCGRQFAEAQGKLFVTEQQIALLVAERDQRFEQQQQQQQRDRFHTCSEEREELCDTMVASDPVEAAAMCCGLAAEAAAATSADAVHSLREEEIDVFLALEASCHQDHDGATALSPAKEDVLESQEDDDAGVAEQPED